MTSVAKWDDSFLVGFDEIDKEHKSICDAYSVLDACLGDERCRCQTDRIQGVIGKLRAAIRRHCDMEEFLMSTLSHPDGEEHVASHKKLHDDFLQMLDFISYCLDQGKNGLVLETAHKKLNELFLQEILHADFQMYGLMLKEKV